MFSERFQPDRASSSTSTAKKRVSIKDIARLAEVSHSTVSRALTGSTLVNPETAEKIRRIAAENGFRASAVARSLATSRTSTLGVVVTSIADPFVADVVMGVEDEAIASDYSVFLSDCHADPGREMKVVESFEERRVDGIIVMASRVGALYGAHFERMRIPIVLLNNQHPSQYAHSILIENFEASRDAVAHLADLGHRRIAYIGDRLGYSSDSERFSGYRAALDAAGVPFLPELVVHGDGKAEAAVGAMAELLDAPELPTAVFCYNDMTALGALRAIRQRGLSVPGDISLVGFDDLTLALYMDPPLTTVHQPKRLMGRMAVRLMLKLIAGSEADHDARVTGNLVVRESTAPPKGFLCNSSSNHKTAFKPKYPGSSSSRSPTGS